MEIRRIRPDDSRMDISRIYEESWKSAYKGIVPQAYLDSIPNGHWAPHLDQPGWHTLICVDEGRAIGTTSFCESRFQQFPSWGEIISLYLLPEYAGQGYGKALLEAALCELKQLGFRDIFLWVLEENHHARLFYEKMGFNVSDAFLEDQIEGNPCVKCSILIVYRIALFDHRRRGISIAPMEQMMAMRKANLVVRMYEKVCEL